MGFGCCAFKNDDDSTILIQAKKKKRQYIKLKNKKSVHINNISNNPYRVRIPKVPSDDIRRKYPMMIINTLNSLDATLMHSFFQQFTHPESALYKQILSKDEPEQEVERLSFYGADDIFSYMFAVSLITPDRAIRICNTKIITRSDTFRTEIILEGEATGTWPYDTDPIKVGHFLQYIFNQTSQECKRPNNDVSRLERLYNQHHLRLAKTPLRMYAKGKITLVINNIYERQELDEIYYSTYGIYGSATPIEPIEPMEPIGSLEPIKY